jgi:hypothetical protein
MNRRGRRHRQHRSHAVSVLLICDGVRCWAGARPAGAPKAGGRALSPARGAAQRRRLDLNTAQFGTQTQTLADAGALLWS